MALGFLAKVEKLIDLSRGKNHTGLMIASYLEQAVIEYRRDGDKIRDPEMRSLIESLIGCRTHSVIRCQSIICRKNEQKEEPR